jgi:carbon-monoxide dehydrogenase large subunit
MKFGVGQAVTRKEDGRFLTGCGRYVDDVTLPGQAHALFVRSPYAHARITGIERGEALGVAGVLGVYADGDAGINDLSDLVTSMPADNADGSPGKYPGLPHLARGVARYVGQPVALIVAESMDAAREASELLVVEYDELPVVVDGEAALEAGAPVLHDDVPGNMAYDWEVGDAAATDAAFADAAHVSRLRIANPRIVVNTMEPRAINVAYGDGRTRCAGRLRRRWGSMRSGCACVRRMWVGASA